LQHNHVYPYNALIIVFVLQTICHAVIGAILFFSVSGVCFAAYGRRSMAAVSILAIPGYVKLESEELDAGTLFATAMMALLSAFAYIADIVVVIATSR
jgi:hypothetical protein